MRIQSKLPRKAYLSAMKDRMEGHMEWGKERFTGFFLGTLFSVTYHSGYEWNRRISNQKNTAIGFVKKEDNGCRVSYICLKGPLAPTQFLSAYLLCLCLFLIPALLSAPVGPEDFAVVGKVIGLFAAITFAIMAVTAPICALMESLTEKSEEGGKILRAFLLSPSDPFSYIHNQNKV